MGRPLFDEAGFLEAARILASEHGPGGVTVDSVTQRMTAPKGSFYHRFSSRDVLLGQLWLKLVLAYQQGFVAAIEAGAGLEAALHMPRWARAHFDDARKSGDRSWCAKCRARGQCRPRLSSPHQSDAHGRARHRGSSLETSECQERTHAPQQN
jgi:AcrR family transcriptional regulator